MSWVMVVGGGAFARAHVHLQTRLRISGMTAPIVLKFGFAVDGLRGWRFARFAVCVVGDWCGWRFARLAVCVCRFAFGGLAVDGLRLAVGGCWRFAFGGWRFGGLAFGCLRLAVCVWRFAFGGLRLAVCVWRFAFGGLHLDVDDFRFAVDGLRLAVCVWQWRLTVCVFVLRLTVCVWRFAFGNGG